MPNKGSQPLHTVFDPVTGATLTVNPDGSVNVTGSSGANPSVGLTGAAAPVSATELGFVDGFGNLQPASSSHLLPVTIGASLPAGAAILGAVTQSGVWTVALSAGAATIGKVSIDQTTPGTTNAVSATNFPSAVDTNSGNKSASTLRVVLATDQPQLTAALKTDGSGVTQPVSGTFFQSTQPVSIAVMPSTPVTGTFFQATQPVSVAAAVTVQQATASSLKVDLSGTAANTTALKVDGSAAIQPVSQSGTWTIQPGNTANTTAWKVDNSAVTQPVDGATASGVAVANPPVTMGGRAATTNPTSVADGQVVNAMLTKHGKVITVDGAPRDLKSSQKTSISNSTAETTIITAGAAGVFNDLYGLILANSGATTTKVDIRDATSGTIISTIEVPTLETRGFMLSAGSAIAQTTAANNWTAQCTSATTALEVTALFIKTT